VFPSLRAMVKAVVAQHAPEIAEALRKAGTHPRTVLAFMELAARLNREIGPAAVREDRPVTVVYHGTLHPDMLRDGPPERSALPAVADVEADVER
jgi:hypothetical protein